jgi:hypothetical protein
MMAVYLLITVACGSLLALAILGLLVYLFVSLLRKNRLFAATIVIAFGLHVLVGVGCWLASVRPGANLGPAIIHVAPMPPPAPEKLPHLIIPTLPRLPELAVGRKDGDKQSNKNPLGENPHERLPGAPNQGGMMPKNPATDKPVEPPLVIPTGIPDDAAYFVENYDQNFGRGEVTGMHGRGRSGKNGKNGGVDDGDPRGEWKRGVPGTRDGRVYFIRLKHGSGAWNAHAEGTRRLLAYLNAYVPCESDTWPMTAAELDSRYLRKGLQPSFLYLYCDDTFTLNPREVRVLRAYLDDGGFLFLDSRPDPAIKELVASELSQILPGSRLTAIPRSHPINTFLFRLSSPGVGLNVIDQANYGISQSNRLNVFYTMGNFAQLYATFPPTGDDYVTAQYQMGANVMLYGIRSGDPTDITRREGARADVTNQAVNRLLGVKAPAAHADTPLKPIYNITPDTPTANEPDEILLTEE